LFHLLPIDLTETSKCLPIFFYSFLAELFVTDIPDWVITEGLGEYDYNAKMIGGPEIYKELFERSPIRHIDRVSGFKIGNNNKLS
jgi:hypothetical protein